MEQLLDTTTSYVVTAIDAIAVLAVVIGVVEVLLALGRAAWRSPSTPHRERELWLRFAQWLIAALTLQLASDIVRTTVAPTWDDIGRLAAIAATRTFLSFFLDRDVETIRERQLRTDAEVTRTPVS